MTWLEELTYEELEYILMLVNHKANDIIADWGEYVKDLETPAGGISANGDSLDDWVEFLEVGTKHSEWRDDV
jgi:hypothetical protein